MPEPLPLTGAAEISVRGRAHQRVGRNLQRMETSRNSSWPMQPIFSSKLSSPGMSTTFPTSRSGIKGIVEALRVGHEHRDRGHLRPIRTQG